MFTKEKNELSIESFAKDIGFFDKNELSANRISKQKDISIKEALKYSNSIILT